MTVHPFPTRNHMRAPLALAPTLGQPKFVAPIPRRRIERFLTAAIHWAWLAPAIIVGAVFIIGLFAVETLRDRLHGVGPLLRRSPRRHRRAYVAIGKAPRP